jgi:hypothetical protein
MARHESRTLLPPARPPCLKLLQGRRGVPAASALAIVPAQGQLASGTARCRASPRTPTPPQVDSLPLLSEEGAGGRCFQPLELPRLETLHPNPPLREGREQSCAPTRAQVDPPLSPPGREPSLDVRATEQSLEHVRVRAPEPPQGEFELRRCAPGLPQVDHTTTTLATPKVPYEFCTLLSYAASNHCARSLASSWTRSISNPATTQLLTMP